MKALILRTAVFVSLFLIISIAADIYYYDRVIQKDSHNRSQISYSDFRVLWFAGFNFRHHDPDSNHNIYRVYNKEKTFYHFRYSPTIAYFLKPFGRMPHQGHALSIWYAILNILFLLSLILIVGFSMKYFALSLSESYAVLWGVFLVCLRFYLLNISLGQTDILILFMFVLFLLFYANRLDVLCGICIAFILQFKLFFLPILLYLMLVKRFRIVLSAGAAFFMFLLLPAKQVGFDKLYLFLYDWTDVLGMSVPSQLLNYKNQSLIYFLGNAFLRVGAMKNAFSSPQQVFYLLSGICIMPSYILLARSMGYGTREDCRKTGYFEISVLMILSLVFSPIAWKSHFMILMIPITFALTAITRSKNTAPLIVSLGAFFLLSCVIGTDLTKWIPGMNTWEFPNMAVGSLFLLYAVMAGYREWLIRAS